MTCSACWMPPSSYLTGTPMCKSDRARTLVVCSCGVAQLRIMHSQTRNLSYTFTVCLWARHGPHGEARRDWERAELRGLGAALEGAARRETRERRARGDGSTFLVIEVK